MFELKIQRNIAISLGDEAKLTQTATEIKSLDEKFEKSFSKFEDLMRKILTHFKGQAKRQVINIEPLRESIYLRLRHLAEENDLNICNKYQDIDNDEFIAVQILKKTEFDKYCDEQFLKETMNEKPEEIEHYTDESSVVSDMSEVEEELKLEKKQKKTVPPTGIYAIQYQKYEKKILTLKISFETPRDKHEYPSLLEYSTDKNDFKNSV